MKHFTLAALCLSHRQQPVRLVCEAVRAGASALGVLSSMLDVGSTFMIDAGGVFSCLPSLLCVSYEAGQGPQHDT
eukprot:1160947-Pelagomonas_calceolata.AAC.17